MFGHLCMYFFYVLACACGLNPAFGCQTYIINVVDVDVRLSRIAVRHSEGPPQRGDSMGATANAGFSATESWA